jgi:hypothetical protein
MKLTTGLFALALEILDGAQLARGSVMYNPCTGKRDLGVNSTTNEVKSPTHALKLRLVGDLDRDAVSRSCSAFTSCLP